MTNWKEYKLSDLMQIKYGKDHKHLADGPFPLYGSGGIMRYVEKPLYSEASILIPRKGTLSNLFFLDKPFWSVDTMFYSIINKQLAFPKYLYYTLKTFDLASLNVGSAVPSLTTEVLNDVLVSVPDIETQTAIAEILSSLDDKIELNNKINQELENLAQTLFKQWFIDFEFPNENGEPYKSSGGEMVESELGEIPKGWKVCKISDLSPKLETGKRPKGGVKGIESGMPSVGAESIKGVGYFDFSKTKYVPTKYAENMRKGIVNGYELLIYKDGGKPGTFLPHFGMFGEYYPFDKFVINEHVFLLDFNNKEYNCFSYFFFDSSYVRPILEYSGGKAAIPGINQGDIHNLSIFHPDNNVVKLFQEIGYSCISSILINCKENTYLTSLRDTLLPKLISGELEVSDILTQTTA